MGCDITEMSIASAPSPAANHSRAQTSCAAACGAPSRAAAADAYVSVPSRKKTTVRSARQHVFTPAAHWNQDVSRWTGVEKIWMP